MEIIISGRHMDVTDELKAYIQERMQKLGNEYGKLVNARIVLEMERAWHIAEGHVTGKHLDLEATARTTDMYASVDEMVDKLEKQLRRYLEKVKEHRAEQQTAEAIKDQMPALQPEETDEEI